MLFYYFGNKEELFDFICEYTLEFARTTYVRGFEIDTDDFLERYDALTERKRHAMLANPEIIAFYESFFREETASEFEKIAEQTAEIRNAVYSKIFDDIDYSLFRDDLDGKAVVNYIKWLMDGYAEQLMHDYKSGGFSMADEAAIADEWCKYYAFVADLRRVFYKEASEDGDH
jgi:AcrR family transcriptional regulator